MSTLLADALITPDVLLPTELSYAIAEKVIQVLERDERLTGGAFTLSNLEELATDIQAVLNDASRYEIAAVR